MRDDVDRKIDFYANDIERKINDALDKITPQLQATIASRIRLYLKVRRLQLSDAGLNKLTMLLAGLITCPREVMFKEKATLTRKQTKEGIKGSVIDELRKLKDALKLSGAAELEIRESLKMIADEVAQDIPPAASRPC